MIDCFAKMNDDLFKPTADALERWDSFVARYFREKEEKLRAKYPALQAAWDQYQIMLKMCQTHEQETVASD